MAFVSLKAWRARSAEDAAVLARLKLQIGAALGLGPGDALTLNAVACPDPGCPDTETIALVMRDGERTRAVRIRRPPADATAEDVEALVEEERSRRTAGAA